LQKLTIFWFAIKNKKNAVTHACRKYTLKHPSEELKVGEQLTFRVISNQIDQKGRVSIKLSRKDLVARPKKKRNKKQLQAHQQRVGGIK